MRFCVPAVLLCAAVALPAFTQPVPPNQPDLAIDAAVRTQVLEGSLAALEKSYVYPDVARRMIEAVRSRERAGDYANLTSAKDFAAALTTHLQAVSNDKHLRIVYSHAVLPASEPNREPSSEQAARQEKYLRSINYGFERAERLQHNIGYLELRSFMGSGPEAEEVAVAAMNFLANSDALIVDLRRNGGGSPHMVALVSSYLFDAPTHLNSLYWREGDRTDEFWTSKEVKGKRFGQAKPVYVLTSKRTFSGAEEFSYNLKNLKRATLVGETTGGGAHPGGLRRVQDHFSIWVPTGRAVSPVTGTNWEGTGVIPDVEVPADQALEKAIELATKAVKAS